MRWTRRNQRPGLAVTTKVRHFLLYFQCEMNYTFKVCVRSGAILPIWFKLIKNGKVCYRYGDIYLVGST
jgi:hypothetical protein